MCETDAGEDSADEPVACTITEETLEEREAFVRATFAPHVRTVEKRQPTGWRLHVAHEPAALEGLTTFVRREHECCSFADYELHVTAGDDPNVLEIYGPAAAEGMFVEGLVEPLIAEFDAELVT